MGYRGIVVIAFVGVIGCASAPVAPPPPAPVAPPSNTGIVEANRECNTAQSDGERCFLLGVKHEIANRFANNDPVARRYFALACDHGSPRGCLYFAQELLLATDDVTSAINVAERGCEGGNREACFFIGNIAHRAYLVTKDPTWRTTACGYGSVGDCEEMLRQGLVLPETRLNLVALYHQACKDAVAAACTALPGLIQAEQDVLRRFVAAVDHQDEQAFGRLVAEQVEIGQIIEDRSCTSRDVLARRPALLACLAPLGLRVEPASDPLAAPIVVDRQRDELTVEVENNTVVAVARTRPPAPRPIVPRDGEPASVAPQALEADRIAGEKNIVPSDADKTMIAGSRNHRLIGSFKVCIDTQGEIANVSMLKTTGVFGYDRRIERTIYSWRYRPFLIDGHPAPVCTVVTFIYSQY
jgi:hypothetical protein